MNMAIRLSAGERSVEPTYALDQIGFVDFETRGSLPIDVGSRRYARHADAIVLAYAIGDGPVTTIHLHGDRIDMIDLPTPFLAHHARVMAGNAVWCAWNAGFDRQVWNHATGGFPALEPHHIIDAMAQATAAGLAPDLKMAAKQCGHAQKDDAGSALIKLFCMPASPGTPATHPQEWEQFLSYAADDIAAMRDVFRCTRQLSLAEWKEAWAMEAINERGVGVDRILAERASRLADTDKLKTAAELRQLTNGSVTTVDQIKRMTEWLMGQLPIEGREILTKRAEETNEDGEIVQTAKFSLTRAKVQRLIALCGRTLGTTTAQRVLELRLYGGSKTPAKFARLMSQQVDGMLHGQYVFNGAPQTGRASSKGVQIHNLLRDSLPYEPDALDAIAGGCSHGELAALGDDSPVCRKLAMLIRPTFVAAPDHVFVWSDWSQIEARILPWLASESVGAAKRLQIFKDVDADPRLPDLYTRSAAEISHTTTDKVDKAMRQRGKVAELALGFGGGVGALQSMAAGYGMFLDDEEARAIVREWRLANGWCVNFWGSHDQAGSYGLWGAANRALEAPGSVESAGRISYVFLPDYLGGSLLCILPSGRMLTYRAIRYESVEDLDDDDKPTGRWQTKLRYARGYSRSHLWHGTLTENVVQAVAADCLRGTLRRIEEETWLTTRLHTHDEIVCEAEDCDAAEVKERLRCVMQQGFDWSGGLPMMSEETIAYHYTKHEGSHVL